MRYTKYILFPFSLLYWLFTYCRNFCFDKGILKQTEFDIPIISVGNITVGGTGKTPHVQYIIQLLDGMEIASLSRGYKRKSKGFVLANAETTVSELGDEPFLLHRRFPNLHVAVCEKRVEGVQKLLERVPFLKTIVLDDAFQHRYIKPGLQILLIDYNRPLWHDHVFPVGFLREGKYAVSRADVVIITKCPETLSGNEVETYKNRLGLTRQKLFFSTMEYGSVYEFNTKQLYDNQDFFAQRKLCLVTGIAEPKPLEQYIQSFGNHVETKSYPDHYSYSETDVKELSALSSEFEIVTTEKDVYKLAEILPKTQLYVIPIMPKILFGKQGEWNSLIQEFVN